MAAPRAAAIVNLGCKVNQSEMEAAARLLRAAGVPLVSPDRAADLYLVNTCTVTSIADEKSRAAVRRARRANPDAEVIVTGCSVQVGPEAFAAVDPAARLVGNDAKAGLLRELEALVHLGATDAPHWPLDAALPTLSGVEAGAGGIDGIADDRASVERTRAFVKVQDGCSFYCTYCIIPRARGPERSLAPEAVLSDVRRALAAGHREIVLTGINIGTYDGGWSERGARGAHVRSAMTLAELVARILDETPVERIRLSSIEPQHLDETLLDVWAAGAPRTLVAAAPGAGEFTVDPSIGLLTFGAALPAAGEVVADYFLGQWERSVIRLEGVLRVDACDRDAATAVDLSDAVVAALGGADAGDRVEGVVTMRLSRLGSLGPPEKDFAQARRRRADFTFQFEHVVDDPESSGGIIRRVPLTTRLKALTTAHGIITEETVTESG